MSEAILEVCLDGVESAIAAEEGGALRIELCDDLVEGGTTPSIGMVSRVCERVSIPVHAIVRPRGGGFVYSPDEFEVMARDIDAIAGAGAAGIVIGALDENGDIDVRHLAPLVERARPLTVNFHRAIDRARDYFAAFDALLELGVDRVLTSGGAPSALQGKERLEELAQRSRGRIAILAGAGIDRASIPTLLEETSIREFHAGSACRVLRAPGGDDGAVAMGAGSRPGGEDAHGVTSAEKVREMVELLRGSA